MTKGRRPELVSRPTADQIERFSRLTVEQRFHWLVDTLSLCFELATPEARAAWGKHKSRAEQGWTDEPK